MLSCHSWDARDPVLNPATTVEELDVKSDFSWRTSENIAFYVKNLSQGVVKITSEEGDQLFHKGYYNGVTESYQIIINIPSYLKKVMINDELVELTGNIIIHEMTVIASPLKSLKSGSSLTFDGENDYIDIDREVIDDYPFTISAWVKTSGFEDDDEDMVIISYADPERTDRYCGIYIGEDEDGVACLRIRNRSERKIEGDTEILDGKWHQIVGVFKSDKDRKLYVNGNLEGSDNRRLRYSDMELLTFGRWGDKSPKSYFKGKIDEIQIWEKALSSSEVQNYYENNPSGNEDGLVAYYKFDEGSGSSIKDEVSGNSEGEFHGVNWSSDNGGSSNTGGEGSGGDDDDPESDDDDNDGIDDDDDDFPKDKDKAFINKYPASGYGTLAFEDLWPARGDYDFNDLVIDYQFRMITNKDNYVSKIEADFVVRAIGASFKNGFGFQFPNDNISVGDLSVTGFEVDAPFLSIGADGLENQQERPTIIVFDNAFDILPRIGGELGVNTDPSASVTEPDTIKLVINISPERYTLNQLNIANFNPFIFVNETRGKEIHLPDYTPTSLADASYFGTLHDNSDQGVGRYYKTVDNLPWAINIYESFDYPAEKNAIITTYLKFASWAETNGESFPDWYQDKSGYRDADKVYSPN